MSSVKLKSRQADCFVEHKCVGVSCLKHKCVGVSCLKHKCVGVSCLDDL